MIRPGTMIVILPMASLLAAYGDITGETGIVTGPPRSDGSYPVLFNVTGDYARPCVRWLHPDEFERIGYGGRALLEGEI